MAKRLMWSKRARKELIEILIFWNKHNKSTTYSDKLRKQIRRTLQAVCENNFIGRPTTEPDIRVTVCDNFLLFYQIHPNEIVVVRIFDGRRNPTLNY